MRWNGGIAKFVSPFWIESRSTNLLLQVITRVVEGSRRQSNAINEIQTGLRHAVKNLVSTSLVGTPDFSDYSHPDDPEISGNSTPAPIPSPASYLQRLFSEREYLTVFCLSKMLNQGSIPPSLASAILLQAAFLKHLSLTRRRLPTVTLNNDGMTRYASYLSTFLDIASTMVGDPQWLEELADKIEERNAVDFVDGRLLKMVLHVLNDGEGLGWISEEVIGTFNLLVEELQSLCGVTLVLGEKHGFVTRVLPTPFVENTSDDKKNLTVLPFSNPVFDKHLASINILVDSSTLVTDRLVSTTISREISHWHNAKRAIDPKKPFTSRQTYTRRWNPARSNQLYMAETMRYAASLSNVSGKILKPETISVGAKTTEEALAIDKKKQVQKKINKEVKQTKAQLIIADNKAKKDDVEIPKMLAGWLMMKKEFDRISDPESRYFKAKFYLDNLESTKANILFPDVILYCMQALLAWWAISCRADQRQKGYHIAALLWNTIKEAGTRRDGITNATAVHIDRICTLTRLPQPSHFVRQENARPLTFKFEYPILKAETLFIDVPQQEFQLVHCGPYMDRNTDAYPDPRVRSFEPDGWQRKVLDELDANRSIFVVAPTSAGKTFISFYAMEMVLRADYEGVLVYVAPTKALVNQIAAEIQARFSKKYLHGGRSVWSIHTRDYRINNPTGCQILVTVPHILQIVRSTCLDFLKIS